MLPLPLACQVHRNPKGAFPPAPVCCQCTDLPPIEDLPAALPYSSFVAVKIHRNFKEALTIRTGFAAEAIHGGQLLGVRAQDFIAFYDWATGKVCGCVDMFCGQGLGLGVRAQDCIAFYDWAAGKVRWWQ